MINAEHARKQPTEADDETGGLTTRLLLSGPLAKLRVAVAVAIVGVVVLRGGL